MVLVTGIAHESWVERLCKNMKKKVYECVDPELDPPFDKKLDFVKYCEEREEFGEEGFMTDKEHEYHLELVQEMKLVGFLLMNYTYKAWQEPRPIPDDEHACGQLSPLVGGGVLQSRAESVVLVQ